MATVVLQTVGAAVGGALGGPIGAVLGRAAGAAAGYALDQKLFAKDRVIDGPRLDNARVLSSAEGSPIPKVYGRNRISGQIIWATRFEETSATQGGGSKSGNSASVTQYSYFGNFAVGICDGPISGIRRIWADGKELDQTRIELRVYTGDEDQLPDPLIEAKQGLNNAPAYRGTAYAVLERLPLEDYGNRIPQLSFEVVRAFGSLEKSIRSIALIPGSTEYGYSPEFVAHGGGLGAFSAHNRHNTLSDTDWSASLDELQMVCPNLESVSLVIAWFGSDLRAGQCEIKPGVTHPIGPVWNVAGLSRLYGHVVSRIDDASAFGGTPDDDSVIKAITDLKARGLKVTVYPFIMMDIPQGNNLADPYGKAAQSIYPWRGEITCHPAIGMPGSVDKSSDATSQLATFFGAVSRANFTAGSQGVHYSGPSEFSYRRFILHYMYLCQVAGGVDQFLIGSEMPALTRIRDENGAFPAVQALGLLADDAKAVMGNNCRVSYAADWSEYFGYHPQDGSNDLLFHLDSLWASSSIDAVGIDNYMPLADWRDAGDPGNSDVKSGKDIDYLKSNIAGGEGYDWFYGSYEDRSNGIRSPITDGQDEPWVWRYKDIVSWWQNPHHERINGVRNPVATAWVPEMKPVMFTETGCPAIDKGANQPNVFNDGKSSNSAYPYFSSRNRDDLIQRRFLQAHFEYWNPASSGFANVNNPVSTVYGGRMLSLSDITPWTWDTRPFPWFPLETSIWGDGPSWYAGHWLTGRLGGCPVDDLIRQILADYGYTGVVSQVDGYIDGYVMPVAGSARAALESVLGLFRVKVFEEGENIFFRETAYADRMQIIDLDHVQEGQEARETRTRASELELPGEVIVSHYSVFGNYEQSASKSRRLEGGSERQIAIQLPAVMSSEIAIAQAEKKTKGKLGWKGNDECFAFLKTSGCVDWGYP